MVKNGRKIFHLKKAPLGIWPPKRPLQNRPAIPSAAADQLLVWVLYAPRLGTFWIIETVASHLILGIEQWHFQKP